MKLIDESTEQALWALYDKAYDAGHKQYDLDRDECYDLTEAIQKAQTLTCNCGTCKPGAQHKSDCAVHNEPAAACDCLELAL